METQHDLAAILDVLCPMHVLLDATGHIVQAGPTTRKVHPSGKLTGARFLEVFELKRPRVVSTMRELCTMAGDKLHLQLRHPPRTDLKGVLVPLGERPVFGPAGGALINLSFGISVLDAVQDFSLSSADFAMTDLAVEMMYLVEAKSAAMEASRSLNLRLQGAKAAAEEQAFTDSLTGLGNRRALERELNELIASKQDFALMHLDLDYFKNINDNLGHAIGDMVLQHAARSMASEVRKDDSVIRAGGDEFILILKRVPGPRQAADVADRLLSRLRKPVALNGQICTISASIGAALSHDYPQPVIEQMMEDADVALYEAKARGRGQHVTYDPSLRDAPWGTPARKRG